LTFFFVSAIMRKSNQPVVLLRRYEWGLKKIMLKRIAFFILPLLILFVMPLTVFAEWPASAGQSIFSSPVIADIDNDGEKEIICTSLSGMNPGGVYVFDCTGELKPGWPQATTHSMRSSPTVGNLDSDPEMEIICSSCDQLAREGGSASANYVFVFNHDGASLPGFPKSFDTKIHSTAVIGNIDNSDSYPEILVYTGDCYLHAWHVTGATVSGYPKFLDGIVDAWGNMVITSSPALADISGDDALEVFIGSTGGELFYFNHAGDQITVDLNNWILSSPSVGDLDKDGDFEVVVGSGDGKVYAFHVGEASLTPVSGWPININSLAYASPALADVDGNDNGQLEVIYRSQIQYYQGGIPYNSVYVWNHEGTLCSGWPKTIAGDPGYTSPVVADIDGDNLAEVVCSSAIWVYAWNHDGTSLPDWPKRMPLSIQSTQAIADDDNDGMLAVIVGDFGGNLDKWELSYDTSSSNFGHGWPVFGRTADRISWDPDMPLPTPTPTQTETQTETQTPTQTVPQTATDTPTLTETPTNTAALTNTPTVTCTPTATSTLTNTPTITATSSYTLTPTATPTLAPEISLYGGPLDFGLCNIDSGPSSAQVITIGNQGNADLVFMGEGIGFSGVNAAAFSILGGVDISSVTPGGAKQVPIAFDPSTPGNKSATLQITTNDPVNSLANVQLSGGGTDEFIPTGVAMVKPATGYTLEPGIYSERQPKWIIAPGDLTAGTDVAAEITHPTGDPENSTFFNFVIDDNRIASSESLTVCLHFFESDFPTLSFSGDFATDEAMIRNSLRVFKYFAPGGYIPVTPVSSYLINEIDASSGSWHISVEASSFSVYGIAEVSLDIERWIHY
jgi:hypothetical protein